MLSSRKAYSIDLRPKIVETYREKEGSIRQVAHRFKVARSFGQKLLKQEQQIGSIAPLSHGGGSNSKLAHHLALVQQLVQENNDPTLKELCASVEHNTGIKVAQSTMCRFLQKYQLTRKKNRFTHHQLLVREYSIKELITGHKSERLTSRIWFLSMKQALI